MGRLPPRRPIFSSTRFRIPSFLPPVCHPMGDRPAALKLGYHHEVGPIEESRSVEESARGLLHELVGDPDVAEAAHKREGWLPKVCPVILVVFR